MAQHSLVLYGDDASARQPRVLVIGDRDDTEMLATFLRTCGYRATQSATESFVGVARETRPAAVFIEAGRSIDDGIEIARTLHAELGKATRLFAVVAHDRFSHERAREAGIERCFAKPVPLADLIATLAS